VIEPDAEWLRGVVQLEDGVDDPGGGNEPIDRGTAPASTVVVRWWSDAAGGDGTTRGTVRDLDGHHLGAFGGFDALVALLRRIFADARRRRS